ncbi:hypothetical protein DVC95_22405 [Salmonella enterica]|nr:hypothetical protein [Salmonella enterica]
MGEDRDGDFIFPVSIRNIRICFFQCPQSVHTSRTASIKRTQKPLLFCGGFFHSALDLFFILLRHVLQDHESKQSASIPRLVRL